jgi:hypothetical protein
MMLSSFVRIPVKRLLVGALVGLTPVLLLAQQTPKPTKGSNGKVSETDLATAKPGRDPNQPIDEEYTKKIKEYTTAPYFLSPLVDYMPAAKGVPTPKAVLGDIAGAPGKLPYSKEVYEYMRLLAKSTPRVRVYSIGTTEEGREMLAVAVASESLMAKLDANKADLAKLADPRTIQLNDDLADQIARRAAPVYYITGTIHSTEAGAPTALMELAYRIAVDESPYVRNIREHLITLITPIVEVDGRDRVVDLYEYKKKHPNDIVPDSIYWGHYVRHDNNRDAMALTLKLSQNVLNTYLDWKAQVLHDLHESGSFLYDNTIGDGPYNAWLDPILTNEWQMIGWNNVNEMTRMGMPGVFAFGTFDTWSPGYLYFMAGTHNGISRLYETFGNGGTADTQDRTLSANETSRTWYRQNPPLPRVRWSLRNNNNYEMTGILISENYIANNRIYFLRNFYDKSKRSIQKAKTEGPAAYVLPANDSRLGSQAELLRVLQKQGVEISKATAPFTVQMAVRRPAPGGGAAGGRGGGGRGAGRAGGGGAGAAAPGAAGAAGGAGAAGAPAPAAEAAAAAGEGAAAPEGGGPVAPATPVTYVAREFPTGSYIVRMDQPYSRIADALLDYQYWAPNDPQKSPYDDTGWTFPEGFAVQAVRVTDIKVLDVPMEAVKGDVKANSGVVSSSAATIFAVNHNADNALVTLRYRLKDADIQLAEEPFESGGTKFNRGTFVIRGVPQVDVDKLTSELGLQAYGLGEAPSVKMHPARAARVAVLHTWGNTQMEGWWRQAFDLYGVPYDYIGPEDIAKNANLRDTYDVIIVGPGANQTLVEGSPMWRNAEPWKNSAETPNIGTWAQTDDIRGGLQYEGLIHIRDFVAKGGTFVAAGSSADLLITTDLIRGVTSVRPGQSSRVVGTLLRTKIADDGSPVMYGVPDNLAVYSSNGSSFNAGGGAPGTRGGGAAAGGGGPVGAAPGPGGRGGGPGQTRATGRGTPDDPDVVQGRPAAEGTEDLGAPSPGGGNNGGGRGNAIQAPLEFRPRPLVRFDQQSALLVSGLLDGGADIAGQSVVVDVPVEKGHYLLFANNPIYRGETIGSYFMVFNALLSFDNLGVGRH